MAAALVSWWEGGAGGLGGGAETVPDFWSVLDLGWPRPSPTTPCPPGGPPVGEGSFPCPFSNSREGKGPWTADARIRPPGGLFQASVAYLPLAAASP